MQIQNPNPVDQNDANSFDVDAIIAETQSAVAEEEINGSEVADLPKKEDGSVDLDACTPEEQAKYWKHRHDASTRGFHSFANKTKEKMNKLKSPTPPAPSKETVEAAAHNADTMEDFKNAIPNFENFDEDTKNSLVGIFNMLDKRAQDRISKDPGVQHGRKIAAEKAWDDAFSSVSSNPLFGAELTSRKADFKAKYFNPGNVPANIEEILTDLAKGYLFDVSRDIGRKEGEENAGRFDLHRTHGGPKTDTSAMTIDDWEELRLKNPQEFARRGKEYNEALKSGKLKE